ncbi:MAG: glycosyltransferase [Methylovirgula sp.]
MQIDSIFQILIQHDGQCPDVLPERIAKNVASVRRLYPTAKHHLFGGDQIRAFLEDNFDPRILAAYDILLPYAFKADLARLCLLYKFGGLYVDLGVWMMEAPQIPADKAIVVFRDQYVPGGAAWAVSNGLIYAAPGRAELKLAIDLIVENVETRNYGADVQTISGPALFGRVFAMANDLAHYWIGDSRLVTFEGGDAPRMSFIAPDGRLIAWRAKSVDADLTHLGLAQTNNYSQIYDSHMAFGETTPAYAPLFARLPWRLELEIAKLLCTLGLKNDGTYLWGRALTRRSRAAKEPASAPSRGTDWAKRPPSV